jgi:hypothetical protein
MAPGGTAQVGSMRTIMRHIYLRPTLVSVRLSIALKNAVEMLLGTAHMNIFVWFGMILPLEDGRSSVTKVGLR